MTLAAWFELAAADRAAAALAHHDVRGPVESMLVRRRWSRDAAEEYVDRAIVELVCVPGSERRGAHAQTPTSSTTLLVSYMVAVAQRLRGRDQGRSVRAIVGVNCDDLAEPPSAESASAVSDESFPANASAALDLFILTPAEREAWDARASGETQRGAATRLRISRAAFRERIASAERRLRRQARATTSDRSWVPAWLASFQARGAATAHRASVVALHAEGFTHDEIAARLGSTCDAVAHVIHRARKATRKKIRSYPS